MKTVQIFPGKVWGGAEQYVLDLGTALETRGHEVTYVARPSKAVTDRLDGRVAYTTVAIGSMLGSHTATDRLASLIKDADVVHVHDLKHVAAVSKAIRMSGSKARIVVTRHVARASRVMPWHRKSLLQIHTLIFVSRLGRELWRSVNGWMPEEKCRVVHNSIPPYKDTDSDDMRRRYGLDSSTPLLMFTGRVRKSKGCQVLVEALGELRDLKWQMVFVGKCKPADFDKELLETSRDKGIASRIGFTGFSDRVRSLIRQSDIGIAPSIVREACPLAPMEFMQAGVCVVATDNGAQPEYISHGRTGILIKPNDVSGTATALRELITDHQRRDTIARRGREYFESEMSYDRFISNILACYEY